MFLISKTVVNHVKNNLFSTSVITFFAGCSAFVQISTENIKEIIDASVKPYTKVPRNDMFIKTGKKDIYSGGHSFTIPVNVEFKDDRNSSSESSQASDGGVSNTQYNKKIRYATPMGFFVSFDNQLGKDRLKKVGQESADYGKDYCVPRKGIRTIYTNYWFRPKIRFKGPWDAETEGKKPLIAKDNQTYRAECSDYTENRRVDEEHFLGHFLYDYINTWLRDENQKQKGLVTFIGADDKTYIVETLNGMQKGSDGIRVNEQTGRQDGEKIEGSEWDDGDFKKYSWADEIKWSLTKDGQDGQDGHSAVGSKKCEVEEGQEAQDKRRCFLKDFVEVGEMYGLAKSNQAGGFTKLKGKKRDEYTSKEYISKYRDRKKAKLKVELEEWLLNSRYLDIRKILQEYRDTLGKGQTEIKQVSTDLQQVSEGSSVVNYNDDLWEPIMNAPWIQSILKRKITQKVDEQKIKDLYHKFRQLQDNQILKKKPDPLERKKLKFNVHNSVQVANTASVSSDAKDSPTAGHSFKVISIEERKDWGDVNPLLIVKGNPLFEAREDQEQLLNDFIQAYDLPFYAPWMVPMLRMISRAKFPIIDKASLSLTGSNGASSSGTNSTNGGQSPKDKQSIIRETLQWWVDYLQYPWRDRWNIPAVKARQFEPQMYERLQMWLTDIHDRNWNRVGSRIIFNFNADNRFYPLGKQLSTSFYIPLGDFKLVGYIEQPTAFFTVISPEYAAIHNLEPIPDTKYKEFRKMVNNLWLTQEDWEKKYDEFIKSENNKKHIVEIGNRKMIIVGLGQTPDLVYPMQSWLTVQPDKYRESLVYVDKYGFNDLKDRGTVKFQEQYITIRVPEEVKERGRQAELDYMKELKKFIDQKLGESHQNYYYLTKLGEDEGNDQIYSWRNTYVPTFQSRIGAISYVLSSAVYAVVLLLLLILIKKYAQSNMYLFGNFIANGVVKADILINICLFAFIPLVAATTIGYLLSLGMQSTFYSILSSYWFLSVKMSTLGATNALYFILKVLAFIVPISYFCSLWTLKDNVSVLLKTTLSMKVNYLTILFYKIMHKITTMWKFRSVLIFNTLNQSGILSMTSVIGFIFLNFFLHNHGKFSKVSKAEQISKLHEYEFDLESPTKESGEYNLATYANLGKYFDKGESESRQDGGSADMPKGLFAVTKGTVTDEYYSAYNRENHILADIWGQYIGNFDGWWGSKDEGKAGKCDKSTGKPSNGVSQSSSSSQEEQWACLDPIGVLEKKDSKWQIYKNSASARKVKRDTNSSQLQTYEHYADKTPIFDFWSNQPEWKKFTENNGSTEVSPNSLGKVYEVNRKKYFLPSLKTLLKLYDNYWILSSRDYEIIEKAMDFFKTKTILRILLDLSVEYRSDVGSFSYNVWDLTSKNLERAQPILQKIDEQNYDQFIQDIIRSKYGPFFVSKFMTQHESTESSEVGKAETQEKTKEELSKLLEKQGGTYQGKKTFMILKDEIGRETQDTNKRNGNSKIKQPTKTLKSNGEKDSVTKDLFQNGLYYLDGAKTILVNTSFANEKEIILVYHPEFLYLILTVIADFATQNGTYTIPLKYTFGNVVHSEEQSSSSSSESQSSSATPAHYFSTLKGQSSQGGRRKRNAGSQTEFDPSKTPEGDQTYTWTKGPLKKGDKQLSDEIKIIGLKEDARGSFYKLYSDGKLINKKLYNTEGQNQSGKNGEESYPIIINKYAAKYYGLKIGDSFKFTPKNHYTRFTCTLLQGVNSTSSNGDQSNTSCTKENGSYKNTLIKVHTLKVVDIFDSYYKESFFMTQKDVNKIIGLNEDTGFNGIFTPKREGGKIPEQLSKALSSYSVSGIYTNVQQRIGNTAFRKLMRSIPPFKGANHKSDTETKVKRNYQIYSSNLDKNELIYKEYGTNGNGGKEPEPTAQEDEKAEDKAQDFITKQFMNAFREYVDPMISSFKTISNHSIAGDVVFKNLGNLTNNVSYLFIFIIFPILLVSLITIVHLLVKDLETVFVTMKLLGFGNKENSAPLIVYLFTLLFVSTFIGSLVVPFLLDKYVNTLFTSQSILLPLSLNGGLMTAVFSVFAVIYLFSIFRSFVKVKGINLPMSVKLLVG